MKENMFLQEDNGDFENKIMFFLYIERMVNGEILLEREREREKGERERDTSWVQLHFCYKAQPHSTSFSTISSSTKPLKKLVKPLRALCSPDSVGSIDLTL